MNTIKLTHPITVDGVSYTELNIRRSKVKDRLAVSSMQGSNEQKEIHLFANLCNVSPDVIKELDEMDYIKIQKAYMAFFDLMATSDEK